MAIWCILTFMTLLAVTACKKTDDVSPQAIVLQIDGFTYEPGYRYRLDVQREALASDGLMDAPPYKYTLVRIMEKTKA